MKKFQALILLVMIFRSHFAVSVFQLAECPTSPNCVSSQSERLSHKVEPIQFRGSVDEFHKLIRKIQNEIPGCEITSLEGPQVSLVVSSRFFRFKDDVEIYYHQSESLIHIRSASRLGYSDLGVNRKRVEDIRKIFVVR